MTWWIKYRGKGKFIVKKFSRKEKLEKFIKSHRNLNIIDSGVIL